MKLFLDQKKEIDKQKLSKKKQKNLEEKKRMIIQNLSTINIL